VRYCTGKESGARTQANYPLRIGPFPFLIALFARELKFDVKKFLEMTLLQG
jgi:hypothetical protein